MLNSWLFVEAKQKHCEGFRDWEECAALPFSLHMQQPSSCLTCSSSQPKKREGRSGMLFQLLHEENSRPECGSLVQGQRETPQIDWEGRLCQVFKLSLAVIFICLGKMIPFYFLGLPMSLYVLCYKVFSMFFPESGKNYC